MTSRRAGAYRTPKSLLLHPVAHTGAGIGVSVPPVHRLALDASAADIGAALRSLLTSPPSAVLPDGWKENAELGKQFLTAAGVRSWKQLETDTVHCWIESNGDVVTLTPLRNGGTSGDRKGFQPFGATVVTVPMSATDAELGAAVLEALARSV